MKKPYQIGVLTPMLHRDPAVWGERAEIFDPDNFSREAEQERPANAYKPFGNGQRACIGRQFALVEATLVLGMILQRFQLVDHARYRLALKETLTVKPDGFRIRVRRRPHRDRSHPPGRPAVRATAAAAAPILASTGPRHGTPPPLLYRSNPRTAEDVARRVAESGEAGGLAGPVAPPHTYVVPGAGAATGLQR